ncbi:Pyridoxal 4-dehydrogenase [Halioglobus japonicus]|nr:Pyridoxal 4-dehydrogenase [Halioglobus japonicus]
MDLSVLFKRQPGSTSAREIGFGAAPLGNLYQAVSDEQAVSTIESAWAAGIRLFDTAPHYGQGLSERRLGDALREKPREDYLLSTKVGRLLIPAGPATERHGFRSPMPFDFRYDYSYDGIMRSYEDSLQRLGLDQIDILLVHDIGTMTHGADNKHHFETLLDSGYTALRELRDNGQIKAIGLGVNEYEICEQALQYGDYDCFLLAGRYSLLEQESLQHFLPLCQRRGTRLLIGGAYNSGILATGTRTAQTAYYNYQSAPPDILARVAQMECVCDEYGVTLAAAALQFPLAHPVVGCVIPGLNTPAQVQHTSRLLDESIPTEFWVALKTQGLLQPDAPTPLRKAV